MKINYKNICQNYDKEVGCYRTFDGNCIKEQCFTYKLLQMLKQKEQECEKAEEFANAKITQCANLIKQLNEVHDQLDELKAENDELKENLKDFQDDCKGCSTCHEALYNANLYAKENIKLKQVITEIKDICNSVWGNGLDEEVDKFDLILQKISEVENTNA